MKHNELRDINCNVREAVVQRGVQEILRKWSQSQYLEKVPTSTFFSLIIYKDEHMNMVSTPEIGKLICKVNHERVEFKSKTSRRLSLWIRISISGGGEGAFSEYCENYRESSLPPLLSEDSGGQGSDESSVSLLRAGSCCSIQTCNDFSVFL